MTRPPELVRAARAVAAVVDPITTARLTDVEAVIYAAVDRRSPPWVHEWYVGPGSDVASVLATDTACTDVEAAWFVAAAMYATIEAQSPVLDDRVGELAADAWRHDQRSCTIAQK